MFINAQYTYDYSEGFCNLANIIKIVVMSPAITIFMMTEAAKVIIIITILILTMTIIITII